MTDCIGMNWLTYGVFSIVMFALAYYTEVVLDIPLWNHECPEVDSREYKGTVQKVIDFIYGIPEMLNQSGYPSRSPVEMPTYNLKKFSELQAKTVIKQAISIYRNNKNKINEP